MLENPDFGSIFTDHMVIVRYSPGRGWHDGVVTAQRPLELHPSTLALHYAQEIYEGLKAFRLPNGSGAIFRPDANARRFRYSASRMAMAELPEELFLEAVRELVGIDREWIPCTDGGSLYLRPFMFASEAVLGVRPSAEYLFCVLATPVGSYFKTAAPTVTLWASETHARAGPRGTGDAKCGGNYAASLSAHADAVRQGCDQAVFLDAVERRWVEELGGMNIFFVYDDGSLQTPPLNGMILAGVTRDSLITLARSVGLTVREAPYALDQWRADAQSGRLREAFACGTAATVAPIGQVKGQGFSFTIGDGRPGPVTMRLKAALQDIQYGRAPDLYGWMDRIF